MNVTKRHLSLRPITDADRDFLCALYKTTREVEMAQVSWPSEEIDAFLTQQFHLQHSYYTAHFPDANFDIIELDGKAIGRFYFDKGSKDIRVIDIALLPKYRNKGIGTHYMKLIMAEAERERLNVTLHVEYFNPAKRLYERLGFEKIDEYGANEFMEWQPLEEAK